MKLAVYLLIIAVLAMLYKTFYYDYQKKEISVEANTSVENPQVSQPEPQALQAAEPIKDDTVDEANRTGWQSKKGMPIDRLGDSIGDSLKDKIKVE